MSIEYPKTRKEGAITQGSNPNPKTDTPTSDSIQLDPNTKSGYPNPNFSIRLHHIRFVIKLSIPDAKMSELSEK